MRIARLATLVLCALGATALPGLAAAAEGEADARLAVFFLEGSDRYEAELVTVGNQVLLGTTRLNVGALYEVRGKVSDERIEARFGNLGRISGRYERIELFGRKQRPDSSGCEDPFSFVRFEGTISFRGEDGYTSIEARRAGGLLIDPAAARCKRRARMSAAGGSPLNTHFAAISKHGGVVTSLALWRKRGQPWATLEVVRQERRGKMRIFRGAATVVGGENALITSGPGVRPPFAFVAAPKPFSGSAVFDPNAAHGAEWSGSLAAWLPGFGKVGLTGPDYALGFCRRENDEPGCDPEAPVRKPLSMLQGSGSQSQALGEARLSWSRYLRNSASSAGSTP